MPVLSLLLAAHHSVLLSALGDQSHRGGVQAAPSDGLPHRPPSVNAGLLAEREKRQAEIWADRQHVGQTHPQPQQPEEDRAREFQVCHPY